MNSGHWLPLYEAMRLWAMPAYGMVFQFRTYHRHRMPKAGGVLIVANHQSVMDPTFVGLATRRPVSFMARESLFQGSRWFARFISRLGAFPLRRGAADMKALRHAVELLRAGQVVLIFPEGTRTPDGRIGVLQAGYAMLARRSGATILPCVIEGAIDVWPRTASFARARRAQTAFCEPITPAQMAAGGPTWVAQEVDRRMLAMQAALRRMHGRPPVDYSAGRWTFQEVTRRFDRKRRDRTPDRT
jgi:1-acyl-sn-glycerol-3-phosphate acyltransferase